MRERKKILEDLTRVERAVYAILKTEANKENFALKKMLSDYERKKDSYTEAVADAKRYREIVPSPFVRFIPIAGRRAQEAIDESAAQAASVARKLSRAMNKISSGATDRKIRMRSYKDHAVWFRHFSEFVRHHVSWSDGALEILIADLANGVAAIKATKGYTQGADLISFLSSRKIEINSWVDGVRARVMEHADRPEPTKRDPDKIRSELASSRNSRIYLPAPLSVQRRLKQMGARIDSEVMKKRHGIGALYLDYSKDLELVKTRFDKQLPLIFRSNKKPFSFEEMPKVAAGQNLRKVFEKETWDFIRDSMLGTTGKRCSVCGEQGGTMLDRFFTSEGDQSRRDTVDCHEVWEFEVIDAREGIGVQRLKKLMMVCVDCHMMFHEEFAISKGYREGADGDNIREFLRERMAALNGVERMDVDLQRNHEIEVTRSNEQVDTWIMDLSYLQDNASMIHQDPVYREANEAGVRVEMIAGLDFITSDGEFFEARDVSAVYEELIQEMESGLGADFG